MTTPVIVTDAETLRQIVREELAALHHSPAQAPAPLKLGFTIPEAADVSGCSEWDIRTAIRRGELHAKQAGQRGKYTIHRDHLDAWLKGVPSPTVPARKGVRQTGQKAG